MKIKYISLIFIAIIFVFFTIPNINEILKIKNEISNIIYYQSDIAIDLEKLSNFDLGNKIEDLVIKNNLSVLDLNINADNSKLKSSEVSLSLLGNIHNISNFVGEINYIKNLIVNELSVSKQDNKYVLSINFVVYGE